jgi:hypothetical protein
MTRFILHIGPHKTGSTYLQNHLTHNRAALIGRGIYYPREWTTPEIAWCHAELASLLQHEEFDAVARRFADLKAAGWPAIVLSSEDFSSLGDDRLRFLRECTGDEVEIVFFARRWSELLRIPWAGSTSAGAAPSSSAGVCRRNFADPFGSETINFRSSSDVFANAFGPSRLKVLSYNNILKRGGNLFRISPRGSRHRRPARSSRRRRRTHRLSIENIELVRSLERGAPGIRRDPVADGQSWRRSWSTRPHTRKAMADNIAEIRSDVFGAVQLALQSIVARVSRRSS